MESKLLFISILIVFRGLNIYGQYTEPIDLFDMAPNSTGSCDGKNYGSDFNCGKHAPNYHLGFDIAGNVGDPIYSVLDGEIVFNGEFNGYGSIGPRTMGGLIIIRHKNNSGDYFLAEYGHLDYRINKRPGGKVSKGDKVGVLNNFYHTGVRLVHLHFAIKTVSHFDESKYEWGYDSSFGNYVMPRDYLNTYCIPQAKLQLASKYSYNHYENGVPLETSIVLKNNSSVDFNGEIALSLHNLDKSFRGHLEINRNETIKAGDSKQITFTTKQRSEGPNISSEPGEYLFFIKYGNKIDTLNRGRIAESWQEQNPKNIRIHAHSDINISWLALYYSVLF